MDEGKNCFKIRALAARHGGEFLLVSGALLIFLLLFIKLKPGAVLWAEIFLICVSLVGLFLGWQKTREPYFSLVLDEKSLTYNHRVGEWSLGVQNVYSFGIPVIAHGIDSLELNAVGIKLKDQDAFLQALPPRLAGHLLVEQRHFMLQAIKGSGLQATLRDDYLIEDTAYLSPQGKKYTGLLAMFANRMNNLKKITGYELLIPASVLDRDIWAFSGVLNSWKRDPQATLARLQG